MALPSIDMLREHDEFNAETADWTEAEWTEYERIEEESLDLLLFGYVRPRFSGELISHDASPTDQSAVLGKLVVRVPVCQKVSEESATLWLQEGIFEAHGFSPDVIDVCTEYVESNDTKVVHIQYISCIFLDTSDFPAPLQGV